MKALIFSLGTRGDVEPLLAIGSILKAKGWDIVCGVPEQFQDIVEDANLCFSPLSKEFLEILESDAATNFMGQKGSIWKKIKFLIEMYKQSKPLQKKLVEQQRRLIKSENPDRVLYNMKCLYPVLWSMANPNKSFMVLPIPGTLHEVTSYSPVLPNSKYGYLFNKVIYWLVHNTFSKQIKNYTKEHHNDFEQLKITTNSIKRYLLHDENVLYTISPSLFEKPDFWPPKAAVMGYFERSRTLNWKPDDGLIEFIEKNKKIMFITFGSMVNTEPIKKTQAILNLLEKHKIAAIINTSSGGLEKPKEVTNNVYFTSTIPYEWIFPKVYAVIHHGGSGTTHTALKYGCANMIIPHILDQFFWNYTISKIGAGPKGISIKNLNEQSLEPLLLELLRNKGYKLAAEKIAKRMDKEAFEDELMKRISNGHN